MRAVIVYHELIIDPQDGAVVTRSLEEPLASRRDFNVRFVHDAKEVGLTSKSDIEASC